MRDSLFDGAVAIAVGFVPLAFAVALLASTDGEPGKWKGALVVGLVGAAFCLLGTFWVTRKVAFDAAQVWSASWFGQRIIRTADVASVQIKLPRGAQLSRGMATGLLVIRSTAGKRVSIQLRSSEVSNASRQWLVAATEVVLNRWQASLVGGETIRIGRRAALSSDALVDGKVRITLASPFSVEVLPGGPSETPLARVEQDGKHIFVSSDVENFWPLREYLQRAQSSGQPPP